MGETKYVEANALLFCMSPDTGELARDLAREMTILELEILKQASMQLVAICHNELQRRQRK